MIFQVNNTSSDFWNSLKLTWQQCADLPKKYWPTSVAELDGKVYVTMRDGKCPLMYDSSEEKWSSLPALPYPHFSLVTVPDRKQLLAIGGGGLFCISFVNTENRLTNKVFLWDEENRKWTTPYPNMPTARGHCSSISHGSTVIVAGGVTHWKSVIVAGGVSCWHPLIMTRAVEVLHIKEPGWFTKSYWSVVEQLPQVMYDVIPVILNDRLYIAQGYDTKGLIACSIVTASLPRLLESNNKNTSSSQVWCKLPDMPYSSLSISHYQGRLITFGGCYWVEQSERDKPVVRSVPLIHIYNPNSRTWDCVGEISYRYLLGRSVHIKENKILFIGGLSGTYNFDKKDDLIKTCSILDCYHDN